MTRNQHCQHFASSLVQEVILPTLQPHALLTPTLHKGRVLCRLSQGPHPCLADPCWDSRLDPQRAASPGGPPQHTPWSSDPVLPRRVPALLQRCAGVCGRRSVEGCFTPFTKPCIHTASLDWPRRGAARDWKILLEHHCYLKGCWGGVGAWNCFQMIFRPLGFERIWV
uniref:Uncharacterized protein n=1 Tax=Molossus molossus TaxID=27622 RepID=A0A7J8CZ88_MOLMO|nr:hypothetical protein HJG59_009503 [Molossus molossus]